MLSTRYHRATLWNQPRIHGERATVSEYVLVVLAIGLPVLYTLAGVTIVRRLQHHQVQEGHNDVLVPMFLTVGTIYAVIVGFLLIGVWEQYNTAKAIIAE